MTPEGWGTGPASQKKSAITHGVSHTDWDRKIKELPKEQIKEGGGNARPTKPVQNTRTQMGKSI